MNWIDEMPDEAFKALIVAGFLLALLSSIVLVVIGKSRPNLRTLLHSLICVAGLSFGAGCLIGAVREEEKLSHGAIVAFAVGVLLTAIAYIVFIVRRSPRTRVIAITVALCTLSAGIVLGGSENTEDCGCGDPTTPPTITTQHA